MKFLVDAQLPHRLAGWLVVQGHEALHTLDLPLANRTTDSEVIRRADLDGRVVVTKDADFVDSHLLSGKPGRLLLLSTGNISNRELLALFERHFDLLVQTLQTARFIELTTVSLIVRG